MKRRIIIMHKALSKSKVKPTVALSSKALDAVAFNNAAKEFLVKSDVHFV